MVKRQIDFIGPTIQDLGLETNNNGNTKKGITENMTIEENLENINGNANNSNTVISATVDTANKRIYNTVQFKMIRDYLYTALGDSDRAEIKLSVMVQELGINTKTLYKHLKNLRETEFVVTKLRYSTEIRRR